ncbi:MAG: hypothetical protein U5Q44_04840 [Dehalococcoidia bacterium]|nr:hypothetical protein [Dehalococcoidia bacterium]
MAANGDFNLDYADCDVNLLGGGWHCDQGDVVGNSSITATADYPDFRKHAPVESEEATIEWTWGGYKEVTVEPGETEQFVYVVFRAQDRDGFCEVPAGATSLHPVLTSADQDVIDIAGGTGVGAACSSSSTSSSTPMRAASSPAATMVPSAATTSTLLESRPTAPTTRHAALTPTTRARCSSRSAKATNARRG